MTCWREVEVGIGIEMMRAELDSLLTLSTLVSRWKGLPERPDVPVIPIERHLHPILPALPPFVHPLAYPPCARWDQIASSLPESPSSSNP